MFASLNKWVKKKLIGLKALIKNDAKREYARRSDLHLLRKCFHMSGGALVLFFYLYLGFSSLAMAAGLACILSFVMGVEYARKRWSAVNQIAVAIFGPILRDTEVGGVTGIPFYVASCLFAFLVFPKHVAVLSILYLALGDPSSSFFGVLYGRSKLFPNKSLEGTLGGFCICAFVTVVYLHMNGLAEGKLAVLLLLGGFAGALAELLPLNVDDNFAIPVVSGLLMTVVFWCAGLPLN